MEAQARGAVERRGAAGARAFARPAAGAGASLPRDEEAARAGTDRAARPGWSAGARPVHRDSEGLAPGAPGLGRSAPQKLKLGRCPPRRPPRAGSGPPGSGGLLQIRQTIKREARGSPGPRKLPPSSS